MVDIAAIIEANYADAVVGPFPPGSPSWDGFTNVVVSRNGIEHWGLVDPKPTLSELAAMLDDAQNRYYQGLLEGAATEIEERLQALQDKWVPLNTRFLIQKKEHLANNWSSATDDQKLLAQEELDGYYDIKLLTGLDYVVVDLLGRYPVRIHNMVELLSSYLAEAKAYNMFFAYTNKWKTSYAMAIRLIAVDAADDGVADAKAKVVAIRNQVEAKISSIPGTLDNIMPGILQEFNLTPDS